MYAYIYPTAIAPLLICEDKDCLTEVSFRAPIPVGYQQKETPLLQQAYQQLEEYFAGRRQEFELPLSPQGTEFQQKVWAALRTIKYGQVATYKDIAILVGNPKGCRAVEWLTIIILSA